MDANKKFATPKGHELTVEADDYGLFYVTFPNGGVLPKSLAGKFTERFRAEQAIKLHLANRRDR